MKPGTGLYRHRGHRPPIRPLRPLPHVTRPAESRELDVARSLLELSCSTCGDWSEAIRHIVQFDAEVLGADRVSFWSFEPESSAIRCEQGYVASSRIFESGATLFESEVPAYFEAIRQARIVQIEDVHSDPRGRGLERYFETRGIGAMLDVPLWTEGRVAGVLCHEHVGGPRRWTSSEADFAMGAGQVVASTLLARAQTRAESAARRAAFLDGLSRRLIETLDRRDIATRAAGMLVPKLGEYAGVHVLNRDGNLERIASRCLPPLTGLDQEFARYAAERSEPPGLAERAVREGQSLLFPDITLAALERFGVGPEYRARFLELGLRTAIAVPLRVAGNTFGALTLFAASRPYGPDDLGLAREVADRVAAALENARFHETACQAVRSREDFVVLASHELRTPLASLQLLVDRRLRKSREGPVDANPRDDEAMARQVRKLTGLVERMLDAIRIQSEGITPAPEPCDMVLLIERATDEVRVRSSTPVQLRLEQGIVGLWDPGLVTKAIHELLDNAIKFGCGKPIELVLRRDDRDVVLTVRDRGVGIQPDRLAELFSPFERAASRKNYGGLGLGLFVAKTIVEAHGGAIAAVSREGEGSNFVMRLPIEARPGR